jgi:membrane-associated PAP2 superfamily phosphatase
VSDHPFWPRPSWRDAIATVLALGLVIAWELSGGDWIVAQHYGQASGFAARDAPWATALYNVGRWLALVAWSAVLASALWPRQGTSARRASLAAAVMVVLAALLVGAVKHSSGASCPWSLQSFGGTQPYVSHWTAWTPGAGTGQCFPSGHASAALAFLPVYVLWRAPHPRLARVVLVTTLLLGAVYGWLQVARGAHFVSHVLWSAWLCWLIAMASPLLVRCLTWSLLPLLRRRKPPLMARAISP